MILRLSKLIDEVFILSSPLPRPLNTIAVHTWLVTNKVGTAPERWEVWQHKNCCTNSWGHVHQNLFLPTVGMPCSIYSKRKRNCWQSKVIGKVEGEQATTMIQYIKYFAPRYPFSQWYFLWPGPNSNTFVQWVINRFPELEIKLPFSAHGVHFSYLIPHEINDQ